MKLFFDILSILIYYDYYLIDIYHMNILLARASNIQEILDINELLGDKDGSMHPKNFILESFKGNRLYICEDN